MKTKIQVLDTDYRIEEDKVTVRVFGKSDECKDVLALFEDFNPYFYILSDNLSKVEKELEKREFEEDDGSSLPVKNVEKKQMQDLNNSVQVLKVDTTVPPNVPKLKTKVEKIEQVSGCREFDIPFYKRFLIDKEIYPAEWIEINGEELQKEKTGIDRVIRADKVSNNVEKGENLDFEKLAFDLEVYEDEIIMASVYSENFQKLLTTADIERDYVEVVESEKDLIKRLMQIIEDRNADIITGYNTDEFDFQVLRERAQNHGLELDLGRNQERMKFNRRGRFSGARLKGRMHLDLYPFIAHVLSPGLESEVLDLDSVAEEMLGRNKDEMTWEEMKEAWRNEKDLEKFADYALKDSELAYKLSKEIIPQILEISRITGLIPFDACRLTYGQLTENYLLREAHFRNIIAPNRPSRDERSKRRRVGAYEGGFVYTPEPGLYEDMVLLDFRSLYPTVMVSHNISPDTLNLEECDERLEFEDYEFNFCQDQQGFFPELVEELVEDRYELKNKMKDLEKGSRKYRALDSRQQAEKILANSFYGYLGYEGARWYSRECAQATTFLGRKHIQDSIEKAEEEGFEIIYGDTDSLFLTGDNVKERIDEFLQDINSKLPSFMELEFEGFFERGFFTSTDSGEGAKKKYALMDEDGNLKITGFEYVRRDWSPIAKETQKKVLRKVLENNVEEAAELVKDTIQDLKAGEIPVEKLKIYTNLTKKPENYDSTAPHVEAAKKAIDKGESISPGETIDYVITRGGGNISSRAELTKYAEDYDSDYYIENQIIPVSLRVLKVFGYTEGQLKGKGKQSGLGRFN